MDLIALIVFDYHVRVSLWLHMQSRQKPSE
jgi:hypothetical protein